MSNSQEAFLHPLATYSNIVKAFQDAGMACCVTTKAVVLASSRHTQHPPSGFLEHIIVSVLIMTTSLPDLGLGLLKRSVQVIAKRSLVPYVPNVVSCMQSAAINVKLTTSLVAGCTQNTFRLGS